MGLRGAAEVKEHPWLKYYAWKDLYNKNIEAPFQHKILEPWDQKYCNAPDKMGIETKERYENIMKGESYKSIFNDYYFYFNPEDPTDRQNNYLKILHCDHDKLQNGMEISPTKSVQEESIRSPVMIPNTFISGSQIPSISAKSSIGQQPPLLYKKIDGGAGDIKVMTNIESKFSKIKQLSNSGSANNILRQYRVSGGGSVNINSQNILSNNNSIVSSNNKSLIGASINSNNSTSTSNQNPQGLRKTSSMQYMGN